MAADWIKMRSNLDTDPDVVAMADMLGIDEFSVVGRLHKFWSWAGQHSSSGTLSRVTTRFIDRFVARDGFSDALAEVGWLVIRSDSLEIPLWDRHNGTSAKARAGEALRKRMQRQDMPPDPSKEMSGHLSGDCPDQRERRVEKEKISDSREINAGARPEVHDDFREVPGSSGKFQDREIPELKTVLAYATQIGLAEWRARDEWDKLECNGWLDGKGQIIRKWRSYFTRVKTWWEADGRPMSPRRTGPNGKPPRQTEDERDRANTGLDEKIEIKELKINA